MYCPVVGKIEFFFAPGAVRGRQLHGNKNGGINGERETQLVGFGEMGVAT